VFFSGVVEVIWTGNLTLQLVDVVDQGGESVEELE
jgi:hypothetical protein